MRHPLTAWSASFKKNITEKVSLLNAELTKAREEAEANRAVAGDR